jgi:hypothetical protein
MRQLETPKPLLHLSSTLPEHHVRFHIYYASRKQYKIRQCRTIPTEEVPNMYCLSIRLCASITLLCIKCFCFLDTLTFPSSCVSVSWSWISLINLLVDCRSTFDFCSRSRDSNRNLRQYLVPAAGWYGMRPLGSIAVRYSEHLCRESLRPRAPLCWSEDPGGWQAGQSFVCAKARKARRIVWRCWSRCDHNCSHVSTCAFFPS